MSEQEKEEVKPDDQPPVEPQAPQNQQEPQPFAFPEGTVLPEGVKTLEDLLKHQDQLAANYAELRKKMSTDGAPKPEPKPELKPEPKPEGEPEEIALTAEQTGRMVEEIRSNGALSPASIKELTDLGFKEEVIQSQVGQAAAQIMREQAVYGACSDGVTDGTALFNTAAQWAQGKLSEDELTGYQTRLDSNDVNVAKAAAKELVDRCRADSPPNLVHGLRMGGADPEAISDEAGLGRAVMDPRYLRDAAYTKKVQDQMRKLRI